MKHFELGEHCRNILITGGAGFIGSHLAEALLRQGRRVVVLDDLSTGSLENISLLERFEGLTFYRGSVRDVDMLRHAADGCDIVFHLAALVGVRKIMEQPASAIETNVYGTGQVLKAALAQGARLVFASTSEVYGKGNTIPFQEDGPVVLGPASRTRWAYAASKLTAEFLVLAHARDSGLDTVIVRLFNTVGPRQTGKFGMVIPRFVNQALSGQALTVYGDGEQTRCFMHVHDAVEGLLRLASCEKAQGLVVNLGATREIRIKDLARLVMDAVQRASQTPPPGWVSVPLETIYDGAFEDMDRRAPDISRLCALTGWKPGRNIHDILHDILKAASP